jgi:predicted peptidase
MTLALLLEAPDFFAAAFPTCQAYQDSWLIDKDIHTLKNIPLWFTHSQLDQICPPGESTFPTVDRLQAAGAKDVRLVKLGEITDASSYRYNPHYSWVPVLNGTCTDPATGESLFSWLCAKSRK